MTGNQLKIELKKLNITQESAAEKLGVTRRTLQNWFSMPVLDANISQNVKTILGIDTGSESSDDLMLIVKSQQRTIEYLSETIKNLTSK